MILALASACAVQTTADVDARLAALSRRQEELAAHFRRLDRELEAERAEARALVARFAAAVDESRRLERRAAALAVDLDARNARAERVVHEAEEAAEGLRRASVAIVVAAVGAVGVRQVCRGRMSPQAYRAWLRERGVPLAGKEVDHVFPRSHGGADHRLNYLLVPAEANRWMSDDVARHLDREGLRVLVGFGVTAVDVLTCR